MIHKFYSTCILCALLTAVFTQVGLAAGTVKPVSYDMINGGSTNPTSSYRDDTYTGSGDLNTDYSLLSGGIGQLTDGEIGVTKYNADLGHGASWEWVGWKTRNASIVFDFGRMIDLTKLDLFGNNQGYNIKLFTSTTVSFSNDRVVFSNPVTYATPASALANPTAQWVNVALNGREGRYAKVDLTCASGSTTWVFLSEAQFSGTAAAAVPEPGSLAALITGLAGFVTLRRRKR